MRLAKRSAITAMLATAAMVTGLQAMVNSPRSADAEQLKTLQRDADAIRDLGITGVEVRVTDGHGHAQVVTSGVGNVKTRRPVPANGHFRMGSVTKTFVATTVLQLIGEGKLSLDDTVDSHLPGVVEGNGNDGRSITIRELLQHTSGIHDDLPWPVSPADYYKHRYDIYTPEQIVARAMRHKPDFAPGTKWSYCNTGYILLGMVIQKVTGRPWYTEVTNRIIHPLGLTQTSWPGTSPTLPRPHANGYTRVPDNPLIDTTNHRDGYMAGSAGGLITTTADLTRFLRALESGKLLRPAQQAEMRDTVPTTGDAQVVFPGSRGGLGILSIPLSCGGRYWFHNGAIFGYTTWYGVTADGRRSVVISMSTFLLDTHALAKAASTLVDHALCTTR